MFGVGVGLGVLGIISEAFEKACVPEPYVMVFGVLTRAHCLPELYSRVLIAVFIVLLRSPARAVLKSTFTVLRIP